MARVETMGVVDGREDTGENDHVFGDTERTVLPPASLPTPAFVLEVLA